MDAATFVRNWSCAPISERAHYQTFVSQLCAVIGVPAPDEETVGDLNYAFERPIRFRHVDGAATAGFIDCYRRGCFVLEAKQSRKRASGGDLDPGPHLALTGGRGARPVSGAGLERLMLDARRQAEGYARALDEWPPFLVVVDVGNCIDLWADFSGLGKNYTPFPDQKRCRIQLCDLTDPKIRERLHAVWTAPMSLDPAARSAAVTTEISTYLARIIRSIESRAPARDEVSRSAWAKHTAMFLMQCVFAMFADSVGLLEDHGFRRLIRGCQGRARYFHVEARAFFQKMDEGGYCPAIRQDIRRFNGGLFRSKPVVEVTEDELALLALAASRDWAAVEPAIFGALLEQALDPRERAELGAHYTPRAYVERLVAPTIIEPLRADWEGVEANALGLYLAGKPQAAQAAVRGFLRTLCSIRVLDPACGTGNFLYVAMKLMKELEGEVVNTLAELGDGQAALQLDRHTVTPEQFLGLEKNARAVPIAEMVMWIGYLQWHFTTFGRVMPAEPILKDFGAVREADALLSWDARELLRDAGGRPVCRQAPRAVVRHPATGEATPDPDGQVEQHRYVNPRPTPWPEAEFIIGNPPFIGGKDMRRELGDGYVEALWSTRKGRFRSADLVAWWWDRAASLLTAPGTRLRRFGFITTNSITQKFSRRVLEHHLRGDRPVRLTFAIPDHPWVKGPNRAAVRIAMTVAERGEPDGAGRLLTVVEEGDLNTDAPRVLLVERMGTISPDLSVGADVTTAGPLAANAGLCSPGMKLHGAGFIVTQDEAAALGLGSEEGLERLIRPYRNGRDLADRPRGVRVIDLFGLTEEEVRRDHPAIYQRLLERVKPERDVNNRPAYRDNWWVFGEPRRELRPALEGLERYIVTIETAKHRWFAFLGRDILPDNKLIVVASSDPFVLGVLSSAAHGRWYAANAAKIGVYDADAVYVKGDCFDPFPFPDADAASRGLIGALAEELDELRKGVLARHDFLTMTRLYNVRGRIVAGDPLSEAERAVHDAGRVMIIHELHERLDRAVAEAYGWPAGLTAEAQVERLLALNAERRIEETRGQVRWLRPEHQRAKAPLTAGPSQGRADLALGPVLPELPTRPDALASALLSALRDEGRPVDPQHLVRRFRTGRGARARRQIEQTLAILSVAGSVRRTDGGWFAPRRAP